jgi:hypothetical protein
MLSTTPDIDRKEFERRTGWLITPEGACKDDRCVPLGGPVSETIDLRDIAECLGMPLIHDEASGALCLGPEAGGKALTSARAPDLTLADWRGERFQLSSLLGQKVLLVAWASW